MMINPDRLQELRGRSRLSRPELAEKAGISPRQLARLESRSKPSGTPRETTINKLAKALGVAPSVLLGEQPMPDRTVTSDEGSGEPIQAGAQLDPQNHLACELVKRCYGVNRTTLFNAAPLMFVLLAEGSLLWRREKLKEVDEAADRLLSLGFGHLSFANAASRAKKASCEEEKSIQKRDIFGKDVDEDAVELGYDRSKNNPFADYIRECARRIDNLDVIYVDDEEILNRPLNGFPVYLICEGEVRRIAGQSREARLALIMGYVRLNDIPEELWAEDRADDRSAWLWEQFEAKHAEAIASDPPLEALLADLFASDEKGAGK